MCFMPSPAIHEPQDLELDKNVNLREVKLKSVFNINASTFI